jgi:hypothetical protein
MVFSALVVSVSWVADIGSNLVQYAFYVFFLIGVILAGGFVFRPRLLFFVLGMLLLTLLVLVLQNGLGEWRNRLFVANMMLAVLATSAFRGRSIAFMKSFNDILYILTLLSLIVLPLVFVQKGLLLDVPDFAMTSAEFKQHRSLTTLFGVSYFVSNNASEVWRNQSIFWEPGMMACLLVLALMFADALGESRTRKGVYLLGILTTVTPGGYAVLAVYLLFRSASVLSRKQMFHLLLGIAAIAVAYLALPVIRDVVLYLFKRDIQNDPSVLIRSTDFWLPFRAAFDSPWFGHPNFDEYRSMMYMVIARERGGMSNSLGEYFYRFGIVWALAFLATLSVGLKRYPNLAGYSFPVLVLTLIYEPIGFSLLFLMLIFGGLNVAAPARRDAVRVARDRRGVTVGGLAS